MLVITYPDPQFKIKTELGKEFIFDVIRKKWVLLTPEEWVRQNFVQYLVQVKRYPQSLIAVEKEVWLGELRKRFDLLIYDRSHHPWMLIECKSMDVPLTEETIQQLLRYNIPVPVPYLVITNGKYCMGWERNEEGITELKDLPMF